MKTNSTEKKSTKAKKPLGNIIASVRSAVIKGTSAVKGFFRVLKSKTGSVFAKARARFNKKLSAKQKRFLLVCAVCLMLCVIGGVSALVINSHIKKAAEPYILSADDAAGMQTDCILVLGAGLNDDATPGWVLSRRLEAGLELYRSGAGKKLIMSGDHGRTRYDEVNAMKAWAMARGVPSEDIFMDHAGFSTYESMYRARDIFCVESMIIVSQKYHLYRSLYDAHALGLEAYAVPCYGGTWRSEPREILARCKDWLWCLFKPEPTFLGDAIPISGSGDLTNDENTIVSGAVSSSDQFLPEPVVA